jgi:hypothetical protein
MLPTNPRKSAAILLSTQTTIFRFWNFVPNKRKVDEPRAGPTSDRLKVGRTLQPILAVSLFVRYLLCLHQNSQNQIGDVCVKF